MIVISQSDKRRGNRFGQYPGYGDNYSSVSEITTEQPTYSGKGLMFTNTGNTIMIQSKLPDTTEIDVSVTIHGLKGLVVLNSTTFPNHDYIDFSGKQQPYLHAFCVDKDGCTLRIDLVPNTTEGELFVQKLIEVFGKTKVVIAKTDSTIIINNGYITQNQ